jgi:hypothetical protein
MSEERIEIVARLNWDYEIKPGELLDVIDGMKDEAGSLDRKRLFIRSLEHLPWHRIVRLWGFEQAREMLNSSTIKGVRSKGRRQQLERLERILRGESLPPAEWNSEMRERLANTVFSNRWYRSKQGIF